MTTSWRRRHPRGAVKRILLQLLDEAPDGLNANLAVAMAAERGFEVSRTTFSGLLSRLKADKIVAHNGYVYRLRHNEKRPESQSPAASFVTETAR